MFIVFIMIPSTPFVSPLHLDPSTLTVQYILCNMYRYKNIQMKRKLSAIKFSLRIKLIIMIRRIMYIRAYKSRFSFYFFYDTFLAIE